jgi:hypothetical protein
MHSRHRDTETREAQGIAGLKSQACLQMQLSVVGSYHPLTQWTAAMTFPSDAEVTAHPNATKGIQVVATAL